MLVGRLGALVLELLGHPLEAGSLIYHHYYITIIIIIVTINSLCVFTTQK